MPHPNFRAGIVHGIRDTTLRSIVESSLQFPRGGRVGWGGVGGVVLPLATQDTGDLTTGALHRPASGLMDLIRKLSGLRRHATIYD